MLRDRGDVVLVHRRFLFLALLSPIIRHVRQQCSLRVICRHIRWWVRKQQIFRQPSFVFRNGRKSLQLFGIHNRQIKSSLGAVIQKNRIHHFTRAWRQPERDVRNAKNRPCVWQSRLDQSNAFDRFYCSADVIFIACRARKYQRIENNIFRTQAVFLGQQFVAALRNRQFTLAGKRLRLLLVFIDAPNHHRGTELVSQRHHPFEFLFAILQVDGIDDGLPLAIAERQFNSRGIGGIDHHRRFHFANQLFIKWLNILFLVSFRALQADIHNMCAAAHLSPCYLAGLFPLLFGH